MKLQYLGTGAAEGIPAVFCTCPTCTTAKKTRGKNIRTRSQALLDGKILFDFPPDTYAHYLQFGFDLPHIHYVLVTHSHMDHFFPAELALHKHPFLLSPIETIHVYGNKAVEARLKDASEKEGTPPNNEFHFIPPFEPVEVEGYRITSFLALHDRKEECRFYAAEHNGKTLLYAHDTGIFPQPVWDYFTKTNMHFDLVSLDCTMVKEKEGTNHMGLPDNIEVRDRLISMGAADKNTRFVVNHFSHGGGLNHKALARAAKKEGFIAAYDGMEIEV